MPEGGIVDCLKGLVPEREGHQHGVELDDKTTVTQKFVSACGFGRAECVHARQHLTFTEACSCPRLGLDTKQRKRKYKERGYPLEHNRTSCCVAVNKSRWENPAVRKRKSPLNRAS